MAKPPRRMGYVDLTTKEVLEEGFLSIERPRKKMPFNSWFFANQESLHLIQSLDKLTDVKVLAEMLKKMDHGNLVLTPQTEIAKGVGIAPSAVSSAIKRLVAKGVIRKKGVGYCVDESLVWRGDLNNFPHKDFPRG